MQQRVYQLSTCYTPGNSAALCGLTLTYRRKWSTKMWSSGKKYSQHAFMISQHMFNCSSYPIKCHCLVKSLNSSFDRLRQKSYGIVQLTNASNCTYITDKIHGGTMKKVYQTCI